MKLSRLFPLVIVSSKLSADKYCAQLLDAFPHHSVNVRFLLNSGFLDRTDAYSGVDICHGLPALYMSILETSSRRN